MEARMKARQSVKIALLVTGQLMLATDALAGQHGQNERTKYQSVFDAARATNDATQSPPMTPHSQAGGTILKSTLIGAAIGATVTTTLAYMLRDCGDCSWGAGKAMISGAIYGGLIGVAVGANLQRGPFPNRRAIVHSTLTPRVKAVSVQVRF
jgi:hypothetical protein